MTGPWWQYVKDSGKTYGWFRGDAVHANERGTQVLRGSWNDTSHPIAEWPFELTASAYTRTNSGRPGPCAMSRFPIK